VALSRGTALILLATYFAGMFFTFFTHKHEYIEAKGEAEDVHPMPK